MQKSLGERCALPFSSLINQVLTSQDYNLIEKDEVFTSFPIYIKPTFPMLKSLGVAGDQHEDTQTKNALLDSNHLLYFTAFGLLKGDNFRFIGSS